MITEPFGGGEFRDADKTMYGELQAQTLAPLARWTRLVSAPALSRTHDTTNMM